MSPILVRPVREQLEHDRVIRLLQVKLKRRVEITANIGDDQTVPVKIGLMQIFPDLVLTSPDRGHKLMGTVEVETSESVNHLEARAQWAHLGRARAPFHLYVPAGSVDIARRLAQENGVNVSEIWSYHSILDQTRFTLVYRAPETRRSSASSEARRAAPAEARPAAKPVVRQAPAEKARPAAPPVKKRPLKVAKATTAVKAASPRAALRARRPATRTAAARKPAAAQKRK